ncbi:MAG: MFS transporter [Clostridiales bacterium]|nr:MFS transporter [Clostridiales bacterium]
MNYKKNISQKKAWYIVFISSLMGCSISAAFPQFSMTVTTLAQETGLSEEFLLTGDTIKSASIVLAMLCSGFIYKKFGAKITFIFALVCNTIPQFLLPFISSASIFMALKIIQGFASVIFPVFLLIIIDAISEKQSGLATAIFNGIFYSGGGIGGTLAGFFIAKHGWISSYFSLGIIAVVIGVIWLLTVKDTSKASVSAEKKLDNASGGISPLQLLKMPVVWLLIISFISTTFVIQAITVDLPLFSQWLGYDDITTGKLSTAVTIGLLTACLVSGRISDIVALRMSNKAKARILVMAIGPIIIAISSLLLIFADLSSFSLFYFAAFLFSFGGSWGFGTFYSILPEIFDDDTLPIVTGFVGGVGDLGMPAAPLLVGVIFGAKGMWHLGWAACIVIAILSLSACLMLYRKNH